MTLQEFIKKHMVDSAISTKVPENPNMADHKDMDHWFVRIKTKAGTNMSLYFSKGFGHNGKAPNVAEVLESLTMDASSVHGHDFETWARDLGYDTDSRKAEKIYKACQKLRDKMLRFLGAEAYIQLTDGTVEF